jgi:hypothetical protein
VIEGDVGKQANQVVKKKGNDARDQADQSGKQR